MFDNYVDEEISPDVKGDRGNRRPLVGLKYKREAEGLGKGSAESHFPVIGGN